MQYNHKDKGIFLKNNLCIFIYRIHSSNYDSGLDWKRGRGNKKKITKSILCHFIYKTLEVKNALLYILVDCNSFFRIAAIAVHLFNCNVRRGHFRGRRISHTQSRVIMKWWPHPRSTNTSTIRRFSHRS